VSALATIHFTENDGVTELVVVDAESGHPVEGATVQCYERSHRDNSLKLFDTQHTDAEGRSRFRLDSQNRSYSFKVSKADDCWAPNVDIWGGYQRERAEQARHEVRLYTDRAIYRPGQTVRLSGLLYSQKHWDAQVVAGQKFTLTMRDANNKEVAQQTVSTDSMGVFAADFVLPDGGLPGQYTIQNLGSQLYIGNQIDNNVTLVSDVPTATYQMFTYDAEGQFKWKDSGTNFTYYIKTYGDNAVGRYYPQGTSGFDAWYLKRVPAAVIAQLTTDYECIDGVVSTSSEVDLNLLKAYISEQPVVTAVDLTSATLPTGTTADQLSALVSGTNALVYINDGSLQGTNIVSGNYCQELRLIDKTDFAPMEETLAAGSATITRKLYPGLNTVCVPLNIAADNIPIEGAKLYTYRGEDNGTLNFTEVTTVEAGTPCIVELPAGTATTEYDLTFNELAAIANAPATTFQIMGTYTNKTLGEGYYKLSEDDTFVRTTATSTIKAFRFYFDLIGAGSSIFKLSLSSDDAPTAITAIQNADEEIIAIYSADGIKRTSLQKGLNIIRYANGNIQKILIK